RLFKKTGSPILRISDQVTGDGRALYERATAQGWEGLIAKRATSRYVSGKRTPDWRKLKIQQEQEFVIGGWTEPRQSRAYFGALLLGVFDDGSFRYVGHVGTGFDTRELEKLMRLMRPLEIPKSPFSTKVPTNERPHWIEPKLVAQVRFTEWTADGILRQPVYLGLRDDKKAKDVERERARGSRFGARASGSGSGSSSGSRAPRAAGKPQTPTPEPETANLVEQLRFLEDARREAFLTLPDGRQLRVGNLHKVFWPALKLTKGDLLRYYVEAAPYILPVVADRPLVMKRFPNGIDGPP